MTANNVASLKFVLVMHSM